MFRKSMIFAGVATALMAVSGAANALTITYDSVVTSPPPNTGSGNWLTAVITNNGTGVDIKFSTALASPEFVTSIFFSLNDTDFSFNEPSTNPDLDFGSCNGNNPAGTGPWQLCMSFDSSDKFNSSSGDYTVFINGLQESAFVLNNAGYYSVAHVQGINRTCSGWVGDNGDADNNPGSPVEGCGGTTVPEPTSLALLGLGLAGLGLARRRRV